MRFAPGASRIQSACVRSYSAARLFARRRWAEELERWLPSLLTPSDLHVISASIDMPPQHAAAPKVRPIARVWRGGQASASIHTANTESDTHPARQRLKCR